MLRRIVSHALILALAVCLLAPAFAADTKRASNKAPQPKRKFVVNGFTVLHSFSNSLDGGNSYGGVIQDASGNLYGTTNIGGSLNGVNSTSGTDTSKLDAAERRRVIDGVIANLKEHYVDPSTAQHMADALLAHEKIGDDDAAVDGESFARLLTRQLRDVGVDMHLDVMYSQSPLPLQLAAPAPEVTAEYQRAMQRQKCTFEKVEILAHNIGYLKMNSFPDLSICQSTAIAAMAALNRTDAIIFDLRDDRGGEPEMVAFIAAYLFDHPEYWYNPRENTTSRSWTRSPVPEISWRTSLLIS